MMNIIFYHPTFDSKQWIDGISNRLPQAKVRAWHRGDDQPADYALVWQPPHEMLAPRTQLKGIFALGAGVDAILMQEQRNPGTLPAGVPLLWPCRWRFRFPILAPQKGNQLERVLCMALFAYAVWMPQTLPENSAVRWSSQMINSLQFQFNRFIHHQIEQ